ncbi:Sensor histidine kinase RcsC [Sporomusa carbonis]|uniref:hybrid sensor histidine kinase/response regulator n=1 Tax=Sporomusa carbonis TaxID=3076075 RepID=UPI003A6A5B67
MEHIQSPNHPEILLVDDTPEHIESAVSVLRDNNFKVRIATKGSTALKLLNQRQPDLILLDVYMPEMDGFEICKIIKNDSNYHSIPIIFLTSSNDEDSIKKGFELGAQDYVVKPFNISELLARVHTHIKLKQQTESLLQANRELDSFCYSVSHDLKAPLLSISKLTEYLAADYSDKLDSDGRELIANIQEKSKEVINIIDHLLEFSRMSEMEMKIESINLEQLFREVYGELIKLEPLRQVQFTIHHLPMIHGDPVMIKLLVLNILSNSLKYTRNRKTAMIEVTSAESGAEYIISVKDNGAGFDMRYSSRLFNVFQRLHSDNEFEGSGVGLAISQKILKRHNGKAWITGVVNEGATFYFSLPKKGIGNVTGNIQRDSCGKLPRRMGK